VWVGENGHTTKAAATDPHLPDSHPYDCYMHSYKPGGGLLTDAAEQTN
jgi:hypothetical protein